jgi:cytochrome b pre-mRNA-processing protein 3
MGFLSRFVRPAKPPAHITAYDAVVAQARQPEFFTRGGVPDTTEGRFELLLLHLFILLHAIRQAPQAGVFGQKVFDTAFDYLDWNLREIGVGDMTVGKKIKRMAEIFYGRVTQYREALDTGEGPLADMIGTTLYPASAHPGAAVTRELAAYVAEAVAIISAQAARVLTEGQVTFPAVTQAEKSVERSPARPHPHRPS